MRADEVSAASLRRHLRRAPPAVIDVGLALGVALAITVVISVAREAQTHAPDALAYALGLTIAALVLARRRWPVAVLVASFVALTVYYSLDYPGISAAVPLAVALYTAAAAGYLRWALGVAAWYLIGGLVFGAFLDRTGPLAPALNELVRDDALMLAVLLLGNAVRSHRALMAETSARLGRADEEQAGRAYRQLPQRAQSVRRARLGARGRHHAAISTAHELAGLGGGSPG